MKNLARDNNSQGNLGAAVMVFAATFIGAFFAIQDPDFFWHLSTGRLTVESGSFILNDPFTYTVNGTHLVLQDWLAQVVFYLVYKFLGGFAGIALLKASLAALSFTLGYMVVVRRGGHSLLGLSLFLVGMISVRHGFVERPYMFSLLLLAATYFLLYSAKLRRDARFLYALPPIFALWGNLHAGFIFGLALIAAFVAGGIVDRFILRRGAFMVESPAALISLALTSLAPLCSPLGYHVYIFPFTMVEIYKVGALTNSEFLFPYVREFPIFWALAAGSVVVMASEFRRLDMTDLFVALGFTLGVLLARRNVVQYMVVVMPITLVYATALAARIFGTSVNGQSRALGRWLLTGAGLLLLLFYGRLNIAEHPNLLFGTGINRAVHPVDAVDFIEKNNINGHMYNDPYWGGYLMWRLYPDHLIFVDSRGHVCLPVLLELQGGGSGGRASWADIVRKYGIDYTIMRYSEAIYPGSPGGERTLPPRDWALVYWDDTAMVYLKRIPKFQPLIERLEYRYVKPDLNEGYLRRLAAVSMANFLGLKDDLQRKLQENPACKRARNFLRILNNG